MTTNLLRFHNKISRAWLQQSSKHLTVQHRPVQTHKALLGDAVALKLAVKKTIVNVSNKACLAQMIASVLAVEIRSNYS